MEGSGSSFVDSSATANTMTANGSATQATTQAKFGTKSLPTLASSVSCPDTSLQPGTGDFTVDWQHYFGDNGTLAPIFSNTFTSGYECDYVAGFLQVYLVGSLIFNVAYAPSVGWHHIAISRSGTNFRVFTDGTQLSTTVTNSSNIGGGGTFTVCDINRSPSQFIDEFRVSIGIARWTANFTPPTAAYS